MLYIIFVIIALPIYAKWEKKTNNRKYEKDIEDQKARGIYYH